MKPARYILLVLCLAAGVAVGEKPMRRLVDDPKLAEGMSKVVAKMKKPDTCRDAFLGCLKRCAGEDKEGCQMECETDCSVCSFEESGSVNPESCKR